MKNEGEERAREGQKEKELKRERHEEGAEREGAEGAEGAELSLGINWESWIVIV